MALGPAGYEIIEAVDGLDGLAKLRVHADLSAVLCDLHMPNMNGLEMIANAQSEGVVAPIVVLTAEADPALMRRARASGAKGWIVKPFQTDRLLAAIQKITTVETI